MVARDTYGFGGSDTCNRKAKKIHTDTSEAILHNSRGRADASPHRLIPRAAGTPRPRRAGICKCISKEGAGSAEVLTIRC